MANLLKKAPMLRVDQVEALLRSFSRAPTSVRNRALVAVLWRCGLRLPEALALRPVDIDRKQREIQVSGSRARVVGIGAGALALVQDWLRVRREVVKLAKRRMGARGPLFCTLQGRPLQADNVRAFLQRKAKKCGLPRVNPLALRNALAVELVERGVDAVTLQQLLGHSSLLVTSRLMDQLGTGDPLAVVRDDGWHLESQ